MLTGSIRAEATKPGAERRRSPRYRLSVPVTISFPDGSTKRAMTIEISEVGFSACTTARFEVGDTVTAEPIGGGKVTASILRKLGNVYGLEFLRLSEDQRREVRELCSKLPLFNGGATGI